MDESTRRLIQAIHDSPPRAVFAAAGAGSRALADLLGVPGASRTLLEALIPYAADSFDEFLGLRPEQYVSADTGRRMAGRALARARHLRELEAWPLVGLGCTAAIVTDRPKKGEHRAHVAAWSPERLRAHTLHLAKGARDRAGEEGLVSALLLNALAEAGGVAWALPLALGPGDDLAVETVEFAPLAEQLHRDALPFFGILPDGTITTAPPAALLSGSFNPLHAGHTALAETAAALLGRPVAFELAAVNADKGPLPPGDVLDRLSQFAGRYPAYAANAPTFNRKARLYPGAVFVVGFDTAERIIQPRYYGDSQTNMLAALDELRQRGNRFLVAGRLDDDGLFHELPELALPPGYEALFEPIPARLFRHDISSTEIRAALSEEAGKS
jgi:hypothetical protein